MATPYATVSVGLVTSTQDQAKQAFLESDGSPLLLTADRQERGRGRFGHTWWQAPRALYSSLAMEEPWPEGRLPVAPLVVGLAVRRALERVCRVTVGLKWPNDLVVEKAGEAGDGGAVKIGGVLVERSQPLLVIGCGVNLWWPEPPDGAAGLLGEDPGPDLAPRLATAWVDEWLEEVARPDWDRAAYLAASVTIGREISWEPGGLGTAVDVDDDGALVVITASGEETLRAGAVRHLRPTTIPDRSADATESDRP